MVMPLSSLLTVSLLGLASTAQAQERPWTAPAMITLLEILSTSCPEQAMLTELQLDDDTALISGLALSNEAVAELLRGLDASPYTRRLGTSSVTSGASS